MNSLTVRSSRALRFSRAYASASHFDWDFINKSRKEYPEHLGIKYLVKFQDKISKLPAKDQKYIARIATSGLNALESKVGVYAQQAADYEDYHFYLDAIMRDYQKAAPDAHHTTNWDLPEGANLQLPSNVSIRVRCARCFAGKPFPAAASEQDIRDIEAAMFEMFSKLDLSEFGREATMYVLTKAGEKHAWAGKVCQAGNLKITYKQVEYVSRQSMLDAAKTDAEKAKALDDFNNTEYAKLKAKSIFSQDMTEDASLSTTTISNAFPTGRSTYVIQHGTQRVQVYINEEDSVRIQLINFSGNDLGQVVTDVGRLLNKMEEGLQTLGAEYGFAHQEGYGYLNSCPTNMGTGMRFSIHTHVPNMLRKWGFNVDATTMTPELEHKGEQVLDKINTQILKPHDLQARGTLGEGTPPAIHGKGTMDLSPKKRTFITEAQIAESLYDGAAILQKLDSE